MSNLKNNYLTDAINIKSYNLSEADKIILMYSKEKGLLRGVAKGAKKTKSKLGGRMDMLVANKLMLFKGKNLDTICQAEALNTFNNLRNDMDKMLYAMYMSEIVSNYGTEDDPNSEEIYDVFYKALGAIAEATTITQILLVVIRFQLKMMSICGYELQLKNCLGCGCDFTENKDIILSLDRGGVYCVDCASGSGIKFPKKLCDFLVAMVDTDFLEKTLYDEKMTEKIAKYCFLLLKSYTLQHSIKPFKTEKLLV